MKIAPILLLLAAAACTYTPSYTGIRCGPDESCPDGYTCIQDHCYPVTEEPAEEVGQDGDAGVDDGDDAGADAEAGDASEDGDTGTDADAAADEGDQDACGGCPPQQYCDENAIPPACKRCEDPSHCGMECQPCAPGESCTNKNGTFCCFPPCGAENACELVLCGGRDYVCRAFFNPLRYDWNPVESNPPHWCRLHEGDGPDLDDLRCGDGNNLRYFCPWDGICEDGQCIHNPNLEERLHPCGAAFGCEGNSQAGHCRMHRKDGQSCQFNYDCESFCCSQDNNAQCIAYNESLCKIHTTLYWELIDLYTWVAKGTTDFHDINEWTFQGDDHGAKCTGDSACDSGHCRHFTVVGENRCEFDGCVDTPEADGIKATYFCPAGDHTQHMTFVTNQNPLPPSNACE
jgi:hypothetical protein